VEVEFGAFIDANLIGWQSYRIKRHTPTDQMAQAIMIYELYIDVSSLFFCDSHCAGADKKFNKHSEANNDAKAPSEGN
jgi:hypothetical protein